MIPRGGITEGRRIPEDGADSRRILRNEMPACRKFAPAGPAKRFASLAKDESPAGRQTPRTRLRALLVVSPSRPTISCADPGRSAPGKAADCRLISGTAQGRVQRTLRKGERSQRIAANRRSYPHDSQVAHQMLRRLRRDPTRY
jgi:hypothetical protein